MDFEPERDYPLGTKRPDLVTTPGGIPLGAVTLEAAGEGALSGAEMRATPETLRRQAAVARTAGRRQLAEGFERAAELAGVPDGALIEIYTALRPRRSTAAELESWAARLDGWGARETASFVREAAATYAERGLLA